MSENSEINPVRYSCGFCFSESRKVVLLIKKNKPTWQAGKLNGIGGHIEEGEDSLEAMRREMQEEAGITVDDWVLFCKMENPAWECNFFYAFSNLILDAKSLTDEIVAPYQVSSLFWGPYKLIPNLHYLIPLALDESVQKPIYLTALK